MYPFAKGDITEWGSRYESKKKINRGVLIRFIGNPYVHQTPENNCFMLLVQLEQIKYSSVYEYIYFGFF